MAVSLIGGIYPDNVKQTMDSQEGERIIISSPGGILDLGYALFESIKSKNQTTCAAGCVASAAAIAFAGGIDRSATNTSSFILHNSRMCPEPFKDMTEEEMREGADILAFENSKLLLFWSSILTIPEDEIKILLAEDKVIDSKEALRIGLIHRITKDIYNMDRTRIFNFLKAKGINPKPVVKNSLTVTPTDGQTYTFPDINTKEEIVEGVAVKDKDNKPFTGEFILQSGETVKCTNGMVDSIEMPMPMMEDEALIDAVIQNSEALSAENEALKAQITNLTAEKEAIKNELNQRITIKDQEIATIKNQLGKVFPGQNKPIELEGNKVELKKPFWNNKTKKTEWK